MGKKVYTYSSINDIDKHPCYAEIISSPHITATSELCKAMAARYPFQKGVIDVHMLQSKVLSDWEQESCIFQQLILIGEVIRTMKILCDEEQVYESFRKNKYDVLNAIRLMVEADQSPDQIVPYDVVTRMFKAIWERVEEEDPSFGRFRSRMRQLKDDPSYLRDTLIISRDLQESDTIVLHGFYFVTPIQDRIFELLEASGKTLIFLCCIDPTLEKVEDIWEKTFSLLDGIPDGTQWVTDKGSKGRGYPFGASFDGAVDGKYENIKVIEYRSELDFVKDVDRILKEERRLFSTDTKATENLLKRFYPQYFRKQHLLSYPVGQFIYQLHSMWKTKSQQIELSIDDVIICFSSGWVLCDGVDAKEFVGDLEKLRVYFSDCITLNDWVERLQLVENISKSILPEFEKNFDNVPLKEVDRHRIMADPLRLFSCFSIGFDRLESIRKALERLIEIAKFLFDGSEEVIVSKHLSKLEQLIKTGCDEKQISQEERVIIKELLSRLSIKEPWIEKCLPGEIADALMIMIGGGLLDEENWDVVTGQDHGFIYPMYQIESYPLAGNGKVHLCLSDEMRLPGGSKRYVWPLSDQLLEVISQNADDTVRRYLQDMINVIKSSAFANRYLFYSLLQNDDVEVSWVSSDMDKTVECSPYITILKTLFGVKVDRYVKREPLDMSSNEGYVSVPVTIEDVDLRIEEEKYDIALCPWRYLYSHLLSRQAIYSSEFHYSFLLTSLISCFTKLEGCDKTRIGKYVFQLFPFLKEIEKRQILDFVRKDILDGDDAYDDFSYVKARLDCYYLTKEMRNIVQLNWEKVQEAQKTDIFSIKIKKKECKFCPYQADCPHYMMLDEEETEND